MLQGEGTLNTSLDFETASRILGSVPIPAAPAAFMDLREQMQQDDPDIDAVSASIARDPGLSARVLKTVNSPFFGLRSQVTSIRQATVLLGLPNVANIVAGLALRQAMEAAGGPAPEHFWDSPVNVGMVAARLVQRIPGASPDQAYMLGLFHDVGMPLMMQRFPDHADLACDPAYEKHGMVTCEDGRYGTNHAVVGYLVSRSWGLPSHIGELILRHHEVDEVLAEDGGALSPKGGLLAVLKMAEHIDQCFWGCPDNPEWRRCGDSVLAYVGISSTDFADVVDDMVDLLSQQ